MTILDRYILRGLLVNFAIALFTMISLYLVLDLLINVDEFTEHGLPWTTVLWNMASFYGPNVFLYYQQLAGVITLFACMATIGKLRRDREMIAILASGVSLFRVAAPVLGFGVATSALLVADTELIIPRVAHHLARDHDEAGAQRGYEVLFLRDGTDRLLSAGNFDPGRERLQQLLVLRRSSDGTIVESLAADGASWEPGGHEGGRIKGRWRLDRARQVERIFDDSSQLGPSERRVETFPAWYESELSPQDIMMRQSESWVKFLSLAQLRTLQLEETADVAEIVRTRHGRIVRPMVGLIMLLLGLPFFLDRSPTNLLSDATKCMAMTGLCYASSFISESVRPESLSALPFWIPIFLFGIVATVMIDRIRT